MRLSLSPTDPGYSRWASHGDIKVHLEGYSSDEVYFVTVDTDKREGEIYVQDIHGHKLSPLDDPSKPLLTAWIRDVDIKLAIPQWIIEEIEAERADVTPCSWDCEHLHNPSKDVGRCNAVGCSLTVLVSYDETVGFIRCVACPKRKDKNETT